MQTVPLNMMAVIAAAIASMLVGWVWYGPLFGKMWMKMSGMKKDGMKKGMGASYAIMFIGSLVMAYVLSYSLTFSSAYLNASGLNAGIMTGFWTWLGFVAPVTLSSVLWEGKSWNLWILKNAHYLISLCVMGAILATWV